MILDLIFPAPHQKRTIAIFFKMSANLTTSTLGSLLHECWYGAVLGANHKWLTIAMLIWYGLRLFKKKWQSSVLGAVQFAVRQENGQNIGSNTVTVTSKKRYGTVSEKRYDFSQMTWSQAFRFKDHSQLNLDHYQVDHDYEEDHS